MARPGRRHRRTARKPKDWPAWRGIKTTADIQSNPWVADEDPNRDLCGDYDICSHCAGD